MDVQIQTLLNLLDRKYISVDGDLRPVDFARVAQFFTLDVISEVAFGECLGFLAKDEDLNNYCQVGQKILPAFEWAAVLPAVNKFVRLPGIRSLVMPSTKDVTGVGMIMR